MSPFKRLDALKSANAVLDEVIKNTPNAGEERERAVAQSDKLFDAAVDLGSFDALEIAYHLPKPKTDEAKRARLTRLVDKALELETEEGNSFASGSFLEKSDLSKKQLTDADIQQGERILAQAVEYGLKTNIRNISLAIDIPVPDEKPEPVKPPQSRNDILNNFIGNMDFENNVVPKVDFETAKFKYILE